MKDILKKEKNPAFQKVNNRVINKLENGQKISKEEKLVLLHSAYVNADKKDVSDDDRLKMLNKIIGEHKNLYPDSNATRNRMIQRTEKATGVSRLPLVSNQVASPIVPSIDQTMGLCSTLDNASGGHAAENNMIIQQMQDSQRIA